VIGAPEELLVQCLHAASVGVVLFTVNSVPSSVVGLASLQLPDAAEVGKENATVVHLPSSIDSSASGIPWRQPAAIEGLREPFYPC
jgi:hypothetical protein